MSGTDRRAGDDPTLDTLFAPEHGDKWFPLTPPDMRPDHNALDVLPEHRRGDGRNLITESSWLQRRIVQERERIDRIETEYEQTPKRHRARRADILGRHDIASSGLLALYERLIAVEERITDLYDEAAELEAKKERTLDRPGRDLARDDVIRHPPMSAAYAIERDDSAERAAREHDHAREGR